MNSFSKTVKFVSILIVILLIGGCSGQKETAADNGGESNYPEKEITLVVPFSAGGTNDTAARIFAEFMTKHLGVSVVVENKPGSGGVVQTTDLVREDPDGYTLQFSTDDPFTVAPSMHDKIEYTLDDFDFLSAPFRSSIVVAVNSNSPYESIEDLNTGNIINVGNPGVGSAPHVAGEIIFDQIGVKNQQIPFSGGGKSLNALLGGDVDVQLTSEVTILPQVEQGNVRVLVVTSAERSPFLDVPTMKELGYDVDISPLMSVYAPAGLPEDVKEVLNKTFKEILADPEFEKAANELNLTVDGRNGEEVIEYLKNARSKYADVIE